jgi:hypothetical protein
MLAKFEAVVSIEAILEATSFIALILSLIVSNAILF